VIHQGKIVASWHLQIEHGLARVGRAVNQKKDGFTGLLIVGELAVYPQANRALGVQNSCATIFTALLL